MEFERKIISMYGKQSIPKHSGELSKLKHEGSNYDHCQEEFMRLSHQVQELPEDYLIGCFICGLRDSVKYEFIPKKTTTMMEAMRLVLVEEEKLSTMKKTQSLSFHKHIDYPTRRAGHSASRGGVAISKGT